MLNIVLLFEADALRQNWIIAGSSLAAACAGRREAELVPTIKCRLPACAVATICVLRRCATNLSIMVAATIAAAATVGAAATAAAAAIIWQTIKMQREHPAT
jgi:hypothetical protein